MILAARRLLKQLRSRRLARAVEAVAAAQASLDDATRRGDTRDAHAAWVALRDAKALELAAQGRGKPLPRPTPGSARARREIAGEGFLNG